MDYRELDDTKYAPSVIPGVLVIADGTWGQSQMPMYICAYCGGKAIQIRADEGGFISRRCKKEECYTLACMTGWEVWQETELSL